MENMTNDPTDFSNAQEKQTESKNEFEIKKESEVQSVCELNDCENKQGEPNKNAEELKSQLDLLSEDVPIVCNGTHSVTSDQNIPSVNDCDSDLLDIDLNDKCNIRSESSLCTDKGDQTRPLSVAKSETAIDNAGSLVDLSNDSKASLSDENIVYDTRQPKNEGVQSDEFLGITSTNNSTIIENSSLPLHHNLEKSDNNLIDVELISNPHNSCKDEFNDALLDFNSELKLETIHLCDTPSDSISTSGVTVNAFSDKKSSEETEVILSDSNEQLSNLNAGTKENVNTNPEITNMKSEPLGSFSPDEDKSLSHSGSSEQTPTNDPLSKELTNNSSNATDSEAQKSNQDLKEKIGNSIKSMFDNNEHLNLNLLEKQNIANLQSNTLKKVNNLFSSIKSYNFPNFRANEEAVSKDKNSPEGKQVTLKDTPVLNLNGDKHRSNSSSTLHDSDQNSMLFSKLNKETIFNDHLSSQNSSNETEDSKEMQSNPADESKIINEKCLVSAQAMLDNHKNSIINNSILVGETNRYYLNSDLIHSVKNVLQDMQDKSSPRCLKIDAAHETNSLDGDKNTLNRNSLDRNDSRATKKSISLDSSPVKHSRYHDVQDELYLLKETNIRLLAEISKLEEENNRVRKEYRTYREEANLFKSSMNEQLVQHENWKEQNRLIHEAEARAHAQTKKDLEAKIDKLKKDFDQANKEKETSVMRYVTKESELINARKEKETVEKKCKEMTKEKDNVLGKLKVLSTEKARLTQMFDDKCTEYNILQRSLDKVTDEVTGKDIKLKWVQSKLDKEIEYSRSMAEKLAAVEEQQAFQVDEQTRLKYSEDSQRLLLQEIDVLKKKIQVLTEENNALSLKVQRLEEERLENDEALSKCKAQVNAQNETISQLRNQLTNMEDLKNQLSVEHERVVAKDSEVEQVQKSNTELSQDMATCRAREAELLQFTEKLTGKNVRLQSEFSALEAKAESLEKEVAPLHARTSQLESELRELQSQLDAERTCKEGDNKALARVVAERSKQLEAASKEIEELKSENQILKRKHTTTVRELNKELSVLKKKAESTLTNGDAMCDTNTISYGSRASSCQSLNEVNVHHSPTSASIASTLSSTLQMEPDRNVIIERLVELQRSHARVIEKAEFLEEHNAQLINELQKKTRILQNYILREQSGALTSRTMDVNKAEVSKHGGIMASLYSSKPVDGGMTLELSLEINRKLQAVLEDTILKNITLKENIDTLGEHIEKLSKKS